MIVLPVTSASMTTASTCVPNVKATKMTIEHQGITPQNCLSNVVKPGGLSSTTVVGP